MTNSSQIAESGRPCTFSILIGRVSTENEDRIFETLDAITRQRGPHTYESIVADRCNNAVSKAIRNRYPDVRLIPCKPGTSLPELRTIALDHAAGEFVVVTEDHCVPPEDWLESIAQAIREAPVGTAAVGGCVQNGLTRSGLDWATFLCEYSNFLPPVSEGTTSVLPGMNIAYRRSMLQSLDRDLMIKGFWETTVHPVLLRTGQVFYSTNRIKILHCKRFSFGFFLRQRFEYSRYYAHLRFRRSEVGKRALAFCLSVALPPVLLYRIVRGTLAKCRPIDLLSALPGLSVFVTIWALGEMTGYSLGSGDALARLE